MIKRREPATRHKSDEEFNRFIEGAESSEKKPGLDPSGERTKKVTITINEYEDDLLVRGARAMGMTKAGFMRMSFINQSRDITEK